jgi:hypothetical protein
MAVQCREQREHDQQVNDSLLRQVRHDVTICLSLLRCCARDLLFSLAPEGVGGFGLLLSKLVLAANLDA